MKHATTILALLGALAPGCMTSQTPSAALQEWQSFRFEGFASRPNAVIILQAYDRSTKQWTAAGQYTTSSNGAPLHFGGYDLYPWSMNYVLEDGIPSEAFRECLWEPDCDAPFGGQIAFRTYEVGSTPSTHVTFRKGGYQCTTDKVINGSDLVEAYSECHPDGIQTELPINYIANHW